MKRIILARHAKAEDRHTEIEDFERSLSLKGKRHVKFMAQIMKEGNFQPDIIFSSPAFRALETASIYAKEFGIPCEDIGQRRFLYEKYGEIEILGIAKEVPDGYNSIMLVGHNPELEDAAHLIIKGFDENIFSCGVVGIKFGTDRWAEISRENCELEFFDYPKKYL